MADLTIEDIQAAVNAIWNAKVDAEIDYVLHGSKLNPGEWVDLLATYGGGSMTGGAYSSGKAHECPTRAGQLPTPVTLEECDEFIGAALRLPRGALAKLYRLLYTAEGMRIDSAKHEEETWLKSLKSLPK